MRIADGVFWQAGRDPQKVAIRMPPTPVQRGSESGDEVPASVTYGELAAAIHRVGRVFRDLGGKPGDIVALNLENRIEYLAVFLGLAHAGFVVAPLNPRLTRAETETLLAEMQPWRIISGDRSTMQSHQWPFAEEAEVADSLDVSSIVFGSPPGSVTADASDEAAQLSDRDVFYLGMSSGTTGRPKGILRTHESWTESFFGMTLEFGLNTSTVMLVPGPLCYSASLIAALHILFIGGTVELQGRFDAHQVAARLISSDVNAVFMVPAMIQEVAQMFQSTASSGSPKTFTCVAAGDTMPHALRRAWLTLFPNGKLFVYFGSSEVGFVSVESVQEERGAEDGGGDQPEQGGLPFFPAQVRVLSGEIQVKSGMGFAGYVRDTESPRHGIRREAGWMASGDLGHIDDRGRLHVLGRATDLIICGGINIYPAEIEQAVTAYGGVQEACAFGIPDDRLGEIPVCAIVWKAATGADTAGITESTPALAVLEWDDTSESLASLRHFLRHRLAGYKLPRRYFSCARLPRNAAGKVVKQQLLTLLGL